MIYLYYYLARFLAYKRRRCFVMEQKKNFTWVLRDGKKVLEEVIEEEYKEEDYDDEPLNPVFPDRFSQNHFYYQIRKDD
jgi:hypothetical protein